MNEFFSNTLHNILVLSDLPIGITGGKFHILKSLFIINLIDIILFLFWLTCDKIVFIRSNVWQTQFIIFLEIGNLFLSSISDNTL